MSDADDALPTLSQTGEPVLEGQTGTTESQQPTVDDPEGFAEVFLRRIMRFKGVHVDRPSFLRQELRKLGLDDDTIQRAVDSTPLQAGVPMLSLDELARASAGFETKKSASLAFAAGLPGGFALLATVPADVTQFYVHAFRVMQKVAYLYGWQDFLNDLEEVDDETLGQVTLFLGVMMGVGGAANGLKAFANQAATAVQKKVAQKALTKTSWYPVVKKVLSNVGFKITKDTAAKGIAKTVPVAGGVISGGMTLVSLRSQSAQLMEHLRELPPPGLDAAEHARLLAAADVVALAEESSGRLEGARAAVGSAASGARSLVGGVAGRLPRRGKSEAQDEGAAPPQEHDR